jgi:hypothetical protein
VRYWQRKFNPWNFRAGNLKTVFGIEKMETLKIRNQVDFFSLQPFGFMEGDAAATGMTGGVAIQEGFRSHRFH